MGETVGGVLAVALLAVACSAAGGSIQSPSPDPASSPTGTPTPTASASPGVAPQPLSDDELREQRVNELGRILVSEWHEIQDTNGTYKTSLDEFRRQLQLLHERGFRPVSAQEWIDGTFPIPAGTSPVLLTFDDAYKEHLYFDEDGQPHADSVVGILQEMERQDPTWRALAVFAYYWPYPFREPDLVEDKLRYLVEHGFELSNHSFGHENLSKLTGPEVQANLGASEKKVIEIVGGDYRITTLTLPFGAWPDDRQSVLTGTYEGFTYEYQLVFEVGWMPTRSPHHAEYNPLSILRVAAHEPWGERTWEGWVDWLDEEPFRRYISDGDPTTVTYPSDFAELADVKGGLAERSYDP